MSLETAGFFKPASIRQDALVLSTCDIELIFSEQHNSVTELVTHYNGSSSACLAITEYVSRAIVPYKGAVSGTGEIQTNVIECRDIIVLFAIGSRKF